MNYFNPYLYTAVPNVVNQNNLFGLLKNIKGVNLNTILNGTQKTLNIINQAIPVFKQMSPLLKNAKTMFRVMNEFKKIEVKEVPNQRINNFNHLEKKETNNTINKQNNNGNLTFFQ